MKALVLTIFSLSSLCLQAQNLFAVKLDRCKIERFCLDCGDIKAGYKEPEFQLLVEELNKSLNLKGKSGMVKFQVLVDSEGKGCVLSHTDISGSAISLKITKELNRFDYWTPAITKGQLEEKSSINVSFTISHGQIFGKIERVDIEAFEKSLDHPIDPEISNRTYTYTNEHLPNYSFTIWNSINSTLIHNNASEICIDTNKKIWAIADRHLVALKDRNFNTYKSTSINPQENLECYQIGVDNSNVKWVCAYKEIYSYNDSIWILHDSTLTGIDGAYDIINNAETGELFFCSDEGLTIYKNGSWTNINTSSSQWLPTNRVYYAKKDSKNRIWVGTFGGSALLDENGSVNFEAGSSVLRGKCITSMTEDENGTIYLSLFEFDSKESGKKNTNEGIAIVYPDGKVTQLTTSNSGLPYNHTNCLLYDKTEKVLWISTDRAGLVRYDLKGGWENYHNQNSLIPTSAISDMVFDNEGNLLLSTNQGIVLIKRK